MRRGVFVTQAEVQRELIVHPEVVLHVTEVHLLTQVRDEDIADRELTAEAEHEIGEVVQRIRDRAVWVGNLARVGVPAVERVDVLHFSVDVLELVAGLERMASGNEGVVQLRVEHLWILPLRIGRLAAEVREWSNGLRWQASRDPGIGRQSGDAVLRERVWRAERQGTLAGDGPRPAKAAFDQRRVGPGPGEAGDELLVGDVGQTVAAATRWK